MKFRLTSVALGFLLLALILPCLNYMRLVPLPDWMSDSSAVGLMALAILVIQWRRQGNEAAVHPVELCLWTLVAVLACETIVLRPVYSQASVLDTGVVVMVALSAGVLRQCVQDQGRDAVLQAMAGAMLVGALLQCCIGLVQVLGLAPFAQGLVLWDVNAPTALMGNIGQRNQLAHYLMWGLIAACYLRARGTLRAWLFYPAAIILALMLAWSASRLVIAYGIGIAVIAWIWLRRGQDDPAIRAWAGAMAFAALSIAVTQLFASEINHLLEWIGLPIHNQSGSQRIMEAGFGARRRIEWQKAWHVFVTHPLIGVGWGNYGAQSVTLEASGLFEHYPESGLFTQAHNFIFQLLAETGLLGTLPVLCGLLWSLQAFFRRSALGPLSGCVLAMTMVTIGHSLFEYPLWYPFFLLGFVMLLALSPAELRPLPIRRWLRAGLAGLFALSALVFVVDGYTKFLQLASTVAPLPTAQGNKLQLDMLLKVGRNPLWQYESEVMLSNYIAPTRDRLQEKRALLERLASYRPYQMILIKLAMLQAYDGDPHAARQNLYRFFAAYPEFTLSVLPTMAPYHDPALAGLRDVAMQAGTLYRQKGGGAVADWAAARFNTPAAAEK